jgi:hypothetical protein
VLKITITDLPDEQRWSLQGQLVGQWAADRDAKSVAGLVVLQSTVRGFKPGSEKERQLTTVAGATSISVNCL